MPHSAVAHVRHHKRFYISLVAGSLVWLLTGDIFNAPLRLSIAGDCAYALYLVLMFASMVPLTPAHLRRRSEYEDEGVLLIFLITIAAILLSLGNIFFILNSGGTLVWLHLALALISVLLGWLTLHTVMAAHYSHIFYARSRETQADTGGLEFPGIKEPTYWEFLYYSFVIGMTAQTSDTDVTSTRMRRLALGHSIVSFFYNTVLIALGVNIVVSLVK